MRRPAIVLLSAALLSLAGLPAAAGDAVHQLDGTWVSNVMTVTIDTGAGTYQGVAMGQPFKRHLTVVSEQANVVTFKAGDSTIVAQLGAPADTVIMTKQPAGMPLTLTRRK